MLTGMILAMIMAYPCYGGLIKYGYSSSCDKTDPHNPVCVISAKYSPAILSLLCYTLLFCSSMVSTDILTTRPFNQF